MLKLIIGVKGTGKTKTLINMVNSAVETSRGNVVCIEKGVKFLFVFFVIFIQAAACKQSANFIQRSKFFPRECTNFLAV